MLFSFTNMTSDFYSGKGPSCGLQGPWGQTTLSEFQPSLTKYRSLRPLGALSILGPTEPLGWGPTRRIDGWSQIDR